MLSKAFMEDTLLYGIIQVRVLIAIVVGGTDRLRLYYVLQEPEDARVHGTMEAKHFFFFF